MQDNSIARNVIFFSGLQRGALSSGTKRAVSKFERMRSIVGTQATVKCFHSFLELSQSFLSVSIA